MKIQSMTYDQVADAVDRNLLPVRALREWLDGPAPRMPRAEATPHVFVATTDGRLPRAATTEPRRDVDEDYDSDDDGDAAKGDETKRTAKPKKKVPPAKLGKRTPKKKRAAPMGSWPAALREATRLERIVGRHVLNAPDEVRPTAEQELLARQAGFAGVDDMRRVHARDNYLRNMTADVDGEQLRAMGTEERASAETGMSVAAMAKFNAKCRKAGGAR